jgi:hypothetical protein
VSKLVDVGLSGGLGDYVGGYCGSVVGYVTKMVNVATQWWIR